MISETEHKKEVIAWLESRGLQAKELERGAEKSADILATAGEEHCLVEVKQKERFERDPSTLQVDPETGTQYRQWIEPSGYRGRFSGLLKEACAQLASSAANLGGDPLRVVWFSLEPPEDRLHEKQLRATLLGTSLAICATGARYCHFSTWSEFYRHRDNLDGVAICGSFGVGLFLNHLSPRKSKLEASKFALAFGEGVYNAESDEAVYCLSPSEAPPTFEWVAAQLLEKHSVVLRELGDLTMFSAEVVVPSQEV